MLIETIKSLKIDSDLCWKMCIVFCLAVIATMLPDITMAQTTTDTEDPISEAVCQIVSRLTGPVGRAIATVAVVFVGIGLFLGKMSWGLAIAVGIGIGAIFGAAQIVSIVGGDDVTACQGTDTTTP